MKTGNIAAVIALCINAMTALSSYAYYQDAKALGLRGPVKKMTVEIPPLASKVYSFEPDGRVYVDGKPLYAEYNGEGYPTSDMNQTMMQFEEGPDGELSLSMELNPDSHSFRQYYYDDAGRLKLINESEINDGVATDISITGIREDDIDIHGNAETVVHTIKNALGMSNVMIEIREFEYYPEGSAGYSQWAASLKKQPGASYHSGSLNNRQQTVRTFGEETLRPYFLNPRFDPVAASDRFCGQIPYTDLVFRRELEALRPALDALSMKYSMENSVTGGSPGLKMPFGYPDRVKGDRLLSFQHYVSIDDANNYGKNDATSRNVTYSFKFSGKKDAMKFYKDCEDTFRANGVAFAEVDKEWRPDGALKEIHGRSPRNGNSWNLRVSDVAGAYFVVLSVFNVIR